MTQESDNDNLLDFTAYKMRSLIEDLAKQGRSDYANAMQDALDSYLLGEVNISFIDGWPYVLETIDDISL
jgi:hypothetical protein